MSEQSSKRISTVEAGLDDHLTAFIATLTKSGYAEKTRRDKKRLIDPFLRWVREADIDVQDVNESCVDAFLACPTRRRYNHRTALRQFVEHLRIVEVVPHRHLVPTPAEVLFQRYVSYLRDRQGLSPHSVAAYSPFIRAFVAARRLPEDAAVIDASAIRSHLVDHSQNRSGSFVKLLAAALRSFLRFCFVDGVTVTDLSIAVTPVHRWRLAAVPPFLAPEEVEQVIAAADRSTERGCRSFAILLLLARLGLRASEVIALELDDIRWEAGEIVVRGKGGLHDRLPLVADVGEALALYLSTARGPSKSRRVFLRRIAPRVGLSQPADVSKIAREALQRAELAPSGRVGAHIFRHSLATRMIRRGASLTEISQVLRHRSIGTTELYAKVDFEGIRAVALPWPKAEVMR
ncbi:MAG: tyrosine-type recombinase/integrase [Vicinamibacterales bacterium]|jgi:site-specific recombinase XerD|nr:tyrosine-type recombinase/integrase [Vicinamibacterales bacterium]